MNHLEHHRASRPWIIRPFVNALHRKLDDWHTVGAQAVQAETLRRCLQTTENSEMARNLGLRSSMNENEFRRAVPLHNYDDLSSYINRVAEGNPGAMFNQRVRVCYFALSSGTTGSRKILPVTRTQLAYIAMSWRLWGAALYRDYPNLLSGRMIQFASDEWYDRSPSGVTISDISGVHAQIQPWFIRLFYCLPRAVYGIHDQPIKYYTYLRMLLPRTDISYFSTATPSTMLSIAEIAHEQREQLIRDLQDGTFHYASAFSRLELRRLNILSAKCSKKRLRELKSLASSTDKKFWPKYFWPKAKLLATWTSGTMTPLLKPVTTMYGIVQFRDLGLISSEGYFTAPLLQHCEGAVPLLENAYYEFIPIDSTEVLKLTEIEPGKIYNLVVTTLNGLTRYRMHDLVQCTSINRGLPVLRFVGKDSSVSDLTGEKLTGHHVAQALSHLAQQLRVDFVNGVVAAVDRGYCLFTEGSFAIASVEQLRNDFDRYLREANFMYDEHRSANKLPLVDVRNLKSGGIRALEQSLLSRSRGAPEQFKRPYLLTRVEDIQLVRTLEQSV